LRALQVKKSADNQQDTVYTLVEVVDEATFYKLSNKAEVSKTSTPARALLSEPIVDPEADSRNGEVFLYLSPYQTRIRYEQIPRVEEATDQLFASILINKKYLDPESSTYELACRSIVIDSPGFDSVATSDVPTKFLLSAKILSVLYQLADSVLFFIQAGNITTQAASQLPMLELSVLLGMHHDVAANHLLYKLEASSGDGSPRSGAFRALIDMFDLSNKSAAQAASSYGHSSVWSKITFVISKADIIWFNAIVRKGSQRVISNQMYEIGIMLATHLRKLAPPTVDSILIIGLPQEQNRREEPYSGDLELLKSKLIRRANSMAFETRLEQRLQELAQGLLVHIQGSWSKYSPIQIFNGDQTTLSNILHRSVERTSKLTGTSQPGGNNRLKVI
jgi:hypothetical protein